MSTINPKRGEIWLVDFEPTKGSEIKKTRPAVVVNSDAVGKLPIRVVVPITEWDEKYEGNLWHVRVDPDKLNGLKKTSALDALQIRSVSVVRFNNKLGILTSSLIVELTAAIAAIIEYE